jgi:hypothetical protein
MAFPSFCMGKDTSTFETDPTMHVYGQLLIPAMTAVKIQNVDLHLYS